MNKDKQKLARLMALALSVVFLLKTLPGMPVAHAESELKSATDKAINIEITTHLGDKQVFQQNDVISFLVSLDRDAFLLMIYQDARNNLLQIIPNPHRQQNHYETGLFIAVPGRDEPFEFVVNPPSGKETVWVFASEKAFPKLEGKTLENGLINLSGNWSDILATIRSSSIGHYYGEASTTITTAVK